MKFGFDATTLACRALVTDKEGNVVARCVKNFHDLEDNTFTPTKSFSVTDGSLGLIFWHK